MGSKRKGNQASASKPPKYPLKDHPLVFPTQHNTRRRSGTVQLPSLGNSFLNGGPVQQSWAQQLNDLDKVTVEDVTHLDEVDTNGEASNFVQRMGKGHDTGVVGDSSNAADAIFKIVGDSSNAADAIPRIVGDSSNAVGEIPKVVDDSCNAVGISPKVFGEPLAAVGKALNGVGESAVAAAGETPIQPILIPGENAGSTSVTETMLQKFLEVSTRNQAQMQDAITDGNGPQK